MDKNIEMIEDAKTKTSVISTTSLSLMSSKTIMISSPRSSESKRMRSSVSVKDSSFIKSSTEIQKESSILIKPSKTTQIMVTQTKEMTPKPIGMFIMAYLHKFLQPVHPGEKRSGIN